MKINRISITNFVNHPKSEIKPARINMIIGPNQSGKSAIRDAIEFNLRGIARGMSSREGQSNLIMNRIGKGEIELELPDIKIMRNTNSKLVINDEVVNIKPGQATIFDTLKVNDEILELLFDTYKISGMSSLERSKYFSKIFSAKTTPDEFSAILKKKGFDQKYISSILPVFSTGGLKKAYDSVVEKRRELKREIGTLQSKEPAKDTATVEGKEINLAEFNPEKKKLYIESLRADITKLRRDSDEHVKWQAKLDDIRTHIDEYSQNVDYITSYLSTNRSRYYEQVGIAKKLEMSEKEQRNHESDLSKLNAQIEQSKSTLDVIKTLDLCELCSKKLNTEFDQKWIECEAKKTELLTSIGITADTINQLKNQMGTDIHHDYETNEKELADQQTNLDEAKVLLVSHHEDEPDDHSDEIGSKETEVNFLNAVMTKYLEYKQAANEYAGVNTRIGVLNIEMTVWDNLAQFVNPESNNLVNPILNNLSDRIKKTSGLFGTDIRIDNETGDILYKNVPIEFCSVSEKYEAGVIVQDAVAFLLNVGILFLDGVEVFVGDKRNILSGAVLKLAMDYNNIFMFASVNEQPKINGSGVNYLWVEKGTVVNLSEMANAPVSNN